MDRDEPSAPQTAPELIDDTPKRISARKLVWIVAVVIILVPMITTVVLLMTGSALTPEENSLVGTWAVVDSSTRITITFDDDGSAYHDSGERFSWSIEQGRLIVFDESQSAWTRLVRWMNGDPDDVEVFDIERFADDHFRLHNASSEGFEFHRVGPRTNANDNLTNSRGHFPKASEPIKY